MQQVIERHVTAGPEVQAKLEQSRKLAQNREPRAIRCPRCGLYLLDVYGHDHYLVRVKCRKCKFDETIDTAFFRTMNRSRQKRLRAYYRGGGA
jgi:phage FluMu protein Com